MTAHEDLYMYKFTDFVCGWSRRGRTKDFSGGFGRGAAPHGTI